MRRNEPHNYALQADLRSRPSRALTAAAERERSAALNMITDTLASIVLFGEKFSPSQAEKSTGLIFTEKHEAGEVGTKHRFKGKAYPFGHAVINAPDAKEQNEIHMLLDMVLPHIDSLRTLGVTSGKLHLTYRYASQCNLEFDPDFLAKLARTGLELTIGCIQDADNQE